MAGDWIKMRIDLANDPAVVGLAGILKTNEYEVVGFLHSLWSWADKHTTDGFVPHVSAKWIDKHIGKTGFSNALCDVGWLICHENGVTLPHFDRHNGVSAKSRAEATERKRLSRKSCDGSKTKDGQMSQKKRDKNVTREEKRREDSKPPFQPSEESVTTGIGMVDPETGEVVEWAA